jgi:Spy/CpxP family protein refolding chaperone
MKIQVTSAVLAGALLLSLLSAQAQPAMNPNDWKFSVTPYL